jgi:tricorn protease
MRQTGFASLFLCLVSAAPSQQANLGYYRYPAIHGQTIVFSSEGDLWEVGAGGGLARRLTTSPGEEQHAAFSPDGKTIAFSANYEGPTDVYTMPAAGGLPTRRTFDGTAANVIGWTPDGKILYATRRYSGLPDTQLAVIDTDNQVELVPLSQASQGSYDRTGKALYFTRLPFQGSYTKRYQGGEVQNIWKYIAAQEAVPLTKDYPGTSKDALWWNGRVYFLSDRDGVMNLWVMDENGKDVKQLTRHRDFDLKDASLSEGRIVYQMGADILVYDIASATEKTIPIQVSSDFDHLREHWVKNPMQYATAAHLSTDGLTIALTSRGRVFVAPADKSGRFVDLDPRKPGRIRDARFFPDGKSLLTLSTESGEVELWKTPANGTGPGEQITMDGKVLRWEAMPSPDGKWIVHQDKDCQLWLLNTADKTQKRIAVAVPTGDSGPTFEHVKWSPDSRWIAYGVESAGGDQLSQILLYSVETGAATPLTTDRYENEWPAWSADGKWIYFISDRALKTQVQAPWGERQPGPYFDRSDKIYLVALKKEQRSPFEPADELHPDKPDETRKEASTTSGEPKPGEAGKPTEKKPVNVEIDLDGLSARLQEVPAPPGNYSDLAVAGERLCWLSHNSAEPEKTTLECLDINHKPDNKPDTVMEEVRGFEVSQDGKKMMFRKQNDLYVVASNVKGSALKDPKALIEAQVDLKSWTFAVIPNDEYREAFADAWRLHRDYFYDRNMHGVDWKAMRAKYAPLVDRVRDRAELNDVIAEMVGELSTLHTFVHGGDIRPPTDQIQPGALGARLVREKAAEGYVVEHIYQCDPDRPDRQSPLARPGVEIGEGDVLLSINGRRLLSAADPGELLRNLAGKQTLLRVKPKGKSEPRDVIVKPISIQQENDLRYHEWEYQRRLMVDKASDNEIGYVHLRAMGPSDIDQWIEQYIPVFTRDGLIVDVRHNGGGNIDSWILGRLMRKAWMYWQPRVGAPSWNMQQAFRGHMVVLCDQKTGSDGEAFAEGFRRLGLGKVIGMRTWGGEVWLTMSNVLADQGIASTGENGVFGPEGRWLIEGRGVDPDLVVDNLPHATFLGKDAQLEAAIQYLKDLIREKPVEKPALPAYPNKALGVASGGR